MDKKCEKCGCVLTPEEKIINKCLNCDFSGDKKEFNDFYMSKLYNRALSEFNRITRM